MKQKMLPLAAPIALQFTHFCCQLLGTAFLFCLAFIPLNAQTQLRVGVMAAPAIQNLTVAEATITDGYKPRLLPQAGILATYGLGKGFSVRLGMRYEAKGFKYQTLPALGAVDHHHWDMQRIDFVMAAAGAAYMVPISDRLTFGGAVDLVYGLPPLSSKHKVVEDGKVIVHANSVVAFYNHYWGMDLALALQYQLPSGIGLRFAPTLQTQINSVLGSDIFLYRFVGFAPRIEFTFPLCKNK